MSGKPPSPPGRGGVDDGERRLWQRAIADAKPLKKRPAEAAPRQAPKPTVPPPPQSVAPPISRPASSAGARTATSPSLLEPGVAAGIDARTLARLKRGLIPPEGEIDLHHLTQAEAHHRLARFVAAAQAAGRRCVLVITGKGFGAEGQVGVLKASVPRWLNEQPNRERILAFCHAPPANGGEGALLVLLRRLRRGDR